MAQQVAKAPELQDPEIRAELDRRAREEGETVIKSGAGGKTLEARERLAEARCFCCEQNGIKIVHPCLETYNGRRDDFHKMASGTHGVQIGTIITRYECEVDGMFTIKEDWIYFDPNMDAKIAEMNPIPDWARKVREWGRIF